MKLKLIIIIALSFILHQIVLSQSVPVFEYTKLDSTIFEAQYTLKYKLDSNNLDHIRTDEILLFLGKNISLSVSQLSYKMSRELNKLTTVSQRQEWHNNNHKVSHFNSSVYKYSKLNQLTFIKALLGGAMKYVEPLGKFDWKLLGKSDTIAGYIAYNAICSYGGRTWIAWFSPELPFNDGPYKFNGLPGLIVRVHDTRNHYYFELNYLEKSKNHFIEIMDYPYINTTMEGYLLAERNIREDIISRVKEAGGGNYSQQVAARNMSKRNNQIELNENY